MLPAPTALLCRPPSLPPTPSLCPLRGSELEAVRTHRAAHRSRRQDAPIPVVALAGYTNAGKSTLLNTLTDAGVLAEDKLFATLDPTTRRVRAGGGACFVCGCVCGGGACCVCVGRAGCAVCRTCLGRLGCHFK